MCYCMSFDTVDSLCNAKKTVATSRQILIICQGAPIGKIFTNIALFKDNPKDKNISDKRHLKSEIFPDVLNPTFLFYFLLFANFIPFNDCSQV